MQFIHVKHYSNINPCFEKIGCRQFKRLFLASNMWLSKKNPFYYSVNDWYAENCYKSYKANLTKVSSFNSNPKVNKMTLSTPKNTNLLFPSLWKLYVQVSNPVTTLVWLTNHGKANDTFKVVNRVEADSASDWVILECDVEDVEYFRGWPKEEWWGYYKKLYERVDRERRRPLIMVFLKSILDHNALRWYPWSLTFHLSLL